MFNYILMIPLILLSMDTRADCYSEEASVSRKMQSFSQRLNSGGGMGFCNTAREAQRIFPEVYNFYNRCSINDPTGQARQYANQMIQWGRETERATCN